MTDKREEQLSAFIDDEQGLDNWQSAEWDPELAAMADTVRLIRSARTYEPPSDDFAERGWQNIWNRTQIAAPAEAVRPVRRPSRKRTGWVAAAASLLVVAVVLSTQPWGRSTVSASEIRVTGGSIVADLGAQAALYPRYAGNLDEVSYGVEDKVWIRKRSANAAEKFPLPFTYMRDAAWSPDGSRAAFAGYPSAGEGPSAPAIWVVGRDGSSPKEIVKPEDAETSYESPMWSPDGSKIAFTSTRAALSDETGVVYERTVMVVNADGTGLTAVAKGREPAWSRDGRRLAYTVDNAEGGSEIWISEANGTQARKLVDGQQPTWSPSKPFIAFTKTRTEHRGLRTDAQGVETIGADISYIELWAVNVESGTETPLTTGVYPEELIARMLADSDERGETKARYAVSGESSDEQAAWSPDGTRILFTRNTMEEEGPHFRLQELMIDYK